MSHRENNNFQIKLKHLIIGLSNHRICINLDVRIVYDDCKINDQWDFETVETSDRLIVVEDFSINKEKYRKFRKLKPR